VLQGKTTRDQQGIMLPCLPLPLSPLHISQRARTEGKGLPAVGTPEGRTDGQRMMMLALSSGASLATVSLCHPDKHM